MPVGAYRLNQYLANPVTEFKLWSAGTNANGRTAQNTTTSRLTSFTQVGTAINWSMVSIGSQYGLAINSLGELYSWGNNGDGRTGQGTTVGNTLVPTKIGTATNWVHCSAGVSHGLAVNSAGELWAWGLNTSGQLGRGNTTSPQTTPVKIGSSTNWTKVSAGANHSMALNSADDLYAWGSNSAGQVGNGSFGVNRTTPYQISGDWKWCSAGGNSSLAITTSGESWVWGSNTNGATGLGSGVSSKTTPFQLGVATNWTMGSLGTQHILLVNSSGHLYGAGYNYLGEVGVGNTTIQYDLVRVGSRTDWSFVATGNFQSMGILTSGALYGWGNNSEGGLGLGNQTDQTSPTQVGSSTNWKDVDAGDNVSIAITQ